MKATLCQIFPLFQGMKVCGILKERICQNIFLDIVKIFPIVSFSDATEPFQVKLSRKQNKMQ